jgi:hypothetical protein
MAPEEVDGEVEVGTSGTTQGKVGSSSNRSPRGSGDSKINTSENGEKEKDKDKSEDKDNKAWQEGDFAYEYVQLAQVRQAFMSFYIFTLHYPINLFPSGVWCPDLARLLCCHLPRHLLILIET